MIAICEFCGKEYKTFLNWYNRTEHHTCSRECAYKLKKQSSTKVCKNCGKEFYSHNHQKDKLFCSRKCNISHKQNNPKLHNKTCNFCGKSFNVDHRQINKNYCSTECRNLSRYKNPKFLCLECGKEFIFNQNKNKKFCSYSCFRTFSDKHSTKKELSCVNCGKIFLRNPGEIKKAKRHFCSVDCRYDYNKGKNHYEWKENLHDKHYKLALKQWGIKVKERDQYTCQHCGETNKSLLEAHHIKDRANNPDVKYELNNGITLCITCHAKEHINNKKLYNLIINKLNSNGNFKKELDS